MKKREEIMKKEVEIHIKGMDLNKVKREKKKIIEIVKKIHKRILKNRR